MRRPLCVGAAVAAVLCVAPVAAPAGSTQTIQLISVTTYSHQGPPDALSGVYSVDSRDDLMNAAPQFGQRSGVRVGTDADAVLPVAVDVAQDDRRAGRARCRAQPVPACLQRRAHRRHGDRLVRVQPQRNQAR